MVTNDKGPDDPQDPAEPEIDSPSSTGPTAVRSLMERKETLARQIQMAVTRGGRVESQSDTNAVVVVGKPVNHILHFLIGVFTCGLWWIVWLILAITGGEKREMITVDEWGNAAVQRV